MRPSASACAAMALRPRWRRHRRPRCGIDLLDARDARSTDGPAGENLRELLHVLLRVAAVDAERVQLEQLARVVFVQPALLATCPAAGLRAARARADRLEVVEVDEHRRMLRRREHHVFEAAEHVRPDRLALVAAGERRDENLGADRDAEMIRPERDQAFDERPIGRHALGERGAAFGRRNARRAHAAPAGAPAAAPDRRPARPRGTREWHRRSRPASLRLARARAAGRLAAARAASRAGRSAAGARRRARRARIR